MGEISRRLRRKLTALAPPGDKTRPPKGWRPQTPAPDIAKLIAEGYDSVHAAYIFVHHITSVFSENVSRLPEMRTYAKEIGEAEDEYLPSGPPMSPLTTSFFSCWAFFDHRIGKTTDTLAACLIEANDTICMNPDQLDALHTPCVSRSSGSPTSCHAPENRPTLVDFRPVPRSGSSRAFVTQTSPTSRWAAGQGPSLRSSSTRARSTASSSWTSGPWRASTRSIRPVRGREVLRVDRRGQGAGRFPLVSANSDITSKGKADVVTATAAKGGHL
jgi:hypothetical protein